MERFFISELISKVNGECAICHRHKLLEYLVMDASGEMTNVCRVCRDGRLSETNLAGEDS
jgi:hypothetical protein